MESGKVFHITNNAPKEAIRTENSILLIPFFFIFSILILYSFESDNFNLLEFLKTIIAISDPTIPKEYIANEFKNPLSNRYTDLVTKKS